MTPTYKFRSDENVLPFLRDYGQYRFSLFKDKIDSFFSSEVVSKLLDQFKEAVKMKRYADSVVF